MLDRPTLAAGWEHQTRAILLIRPFDKGVPIARGHNAYFGLLIDNISYDSDCEWLVTKAVLLKQNNTYCQGE